MSPLAGRRLHALGLGCISRLLKATFNRWLILGNSNVRECNTPDTVIFTHAWNTSVGDEGGSTCNNLSACADDVGGRHHTFFTTTVGREIPTSGTSTLDGRTHMRSAVPCKLREQIFRCTDIQTKLSPQSEEPYRPLEIKIFSSE